MWLCRILPIFFLLVAILWLVYPKAWDNSVYFLVLLFLSIPYFLLVAGLLPAILFEGEFRYKWYGPLLRFGSAPYWYLPFALLSCGFGPVIWYWVKYDSILRKMGISIQQKL